MIGRFISADTIVPSAPALTVAPSDAVAQGMWGQQGAAINPQELNRYSYVNNNPINATDPTGHFLDTILDVAFIAYGIYDIAANGYTAERGLALAADVGGALIPGLTGAGAMVRAAAHADDVVDAVKVASNTADAVKAACSFPADTPVLTDDGAVAISDIAVGQQVVAWDEANGTTGTYTVTASWAHLDPVIIVLTLDGERLEATPEHPFYVVGKGWTTAAALQVGDAVQQADGTPGRVDAVMIEQRPQVMYNLTVATAHTYFVGEGEWLVHNACGGGSIDRIYRAVTPSEAQDLRKTGMFRSPNTSGAPDGKYFAETPAHADQWGKTMYGKGNYSVVAAKVSGDVPYHKFDNLDTIGPARYYDADSLSSIRYRGPVRKP